MELTDCEKLKLLDIPISAFRIGYNCHEKNIGVVTNIMINSAERENHRIIMVFNDGQWTLQTGEDRQLLSATDIEKMLVESLVAGITPPPFAVLSFHLLDNLQRLKSNQTSDVKAFLESIAQPLTNELRNSKYRGEVSFDAVH